MRIVILSCYSGEAERGVETWASELTKRFRDSIEVISGNYLKKIKEWISADIIIPTNGRFQVLIVRIITFFIGKPMLVFGHSGPGADDKWNLLCSPNYFVSFTNSQKKWADQYKFPWTKSIVVSHAVDTQKFTPAQKRSNKSIILCVAANTKSKRVELVEQAARKVPNSTLIVAGSGQKLVVPFSRMPEMYKKASVFCFVPEPWEAFGLVYLEALACNLPIVTIDDPIRREIVGDAGLLVKDPTDSSLLASIIKKALAINWGDKPRKQAELFSWDTIREKYTTLFNEVLYGK